MHLKKKVDVLSSLLLIFWFLLLLYSFYNDCLLVNEFGGAEVGFLEDYDVYLYLFLVIIAYFSMVGVYLNYDQIHKIIIKLWKLPSSEKRRDTRIISHSRFSAICQLLFLSAIFIVTFILMYETGPDDYFVWQDGSLIEVILLTSLLATGTFFLFLFLFMVYEYRHKIMSLLNRLENRANKNFKIIYINRNLLKIISKNFTLNAIAISLMSLFFISTSFTHRMLFRDIDDYIEAFIFYFSSAILILFFSLVFIWDVLKPDKKFNNIMQKIITKEKVNFNKKIEFSKLTEKEMLEYEKYLSEISGLQSHLISFPTAIIGVVVAIVSIVIRIMI